MSPTLAAILIAVGAYTVLDVSKVYQRKGLALKLTAPTKGWTLWVFATIATLTPPLAVQFAVWLSNLSLVGAMAGTGLAAVAMYSRLVNGEVLGFYRRVGVVVIMGATWLIGWYGEVPPTRASLGLLWIVLGATCVLFGVAWALVYGSRSGTGPTIAAFAGTLSGFVTVFQEAATTGDAQSFSLAAALNAMSERLGIMESPLVEGAIGTIGNPYGAAWILLSWASFFVLQFSYRWGTVTFIMPAFTATMVLVPVLGGVVLFGEGLPLLAWLGVLLMTGGVVLTSVEGRPDPDLDELRFLGRLKRQDPSAKDVSATSPAAQDQGGQAPRPRSSSPPISSNDA